MYGVVLDVVVFGVLTEFSVILVIKKKFQSSVIDQKSAYFLANLKDQNYLDDT